MTLRLSYGTIRSAISQWRGTEAAASVPMTGERRTWCCYSMTTICPARVIMRRFFTSISNVKAVLATVLLGNCLAAEMALADPGEPVAQEAATPEMPSCDMDDIVVDRFNPSSLIGLPCASHSRILTEAAAAARAYLIATARPGYTMTRQGPELAIGRLHPAFVVRLSNAVREARQAGLASAGIFSAYRPPAFGIGGFVDKFHSLHTYGLAVDVYGIGGPGTPEAQLWHDIAGKHGVVCPYGPHNPSEWNHCQPTRVKIILADNLCARPLLRRVQSALRACSKSATRWSP